MEDALRELREGLCRGYAQSGQNRLACKPYREGTVKLARSLATGSAEEIDVRPVVMGRPARANHSESETFTAGRGARGSPATGLNILMKYLPWM